MTYSNKGRSMIHNKKWLLLSMLALTAATVRPNEVQLEEFGARMGATIITGTAVGAFTGYAIGYLSGTMFDAIINALSFPISFTGTDDKFDYANYNKYQALIAATKLGVKLGCKYVWEKPLRNKIMNWIIEDMKTHSVPCNEELMKTTARVAAYMACVGA